MGEIDYKKQGKANRAKGARFELKVRKSLEEAGWTVSKWQNNVDLEKQMIVKAKGNRFKMNSTGFPDFVAFMEKSRTSNQNASYKVILVESKTNGSLSKLERDKINALLKMGFECWVGYDENGKVGYKKLMEREGSDKLCRGQVRYNLR